MKVIASNKKAYHNYFIKDKYEAGISLKGHEVKSIRQGSVSLLDGHVDIKNNEAFLVNVFIKKYDKQNNFENDEKKTRRLLLNKKEILKLQKQKLEKGYTVIPLKIYINKKGLVKLEIAVAQGKKLYDKRRSIKEKDEKKRLNIELSKYN